MALLPPPPGKRLGLVLALFIVGFLATLEVSAQSAQRSTQPRPTGVSAAELIADLASQAQGQEN
ncbi:MAG: hypothetical protein ACI84D_002138 [Thalassolituus oleivorans]|jgi:hypothetical protein